MINVIVQKGCREGGKSSRDHEILNDCLTKMKPGAPGELLK